MPSIQINSTNINTFSFNASFDIKNRAVIFDSSPTIYNGASGSGDLYVQGISFSLIDQDGVVLSSISFAPPQIPSPATNPIYTLDLSNINQSFLFQTYQIIGAIKDQDGTVYSTLPIYKKICEPIGLGDNGTISGEFQLIADCSNNSLTVKELTPFAYNSQIPTTISKSGTLYYPTGTVSPVTFTNTPFSNSYIVTGAYLVNNTTIATYDFGDGVFVILAYWTYNNFDITCSNTMSSVLCCIWETQREQQKNCNNARGLAAAEKLAEVTPYLLSGFIAEQSGIDASEQALAIRKILNCGCGKKGNQQNELNPVNPSIYSIVLQGAGGTTIPSAVTNGNTKTWTISSLTSKVSKGNPSDLAWSITLDNSVTNVNNFVITFNYGVFAGYIYTATAASTPLLTQFNALVKKVYSDNYLINTFSYLVCGGTPITLYSSVPFAVGVTMYFDSALTRPVTGFLLITQLKNGNIYNLNIATGVVGASTGTHC